MLSRQSTKPNLFAKYQTETDWELQEAVDSWEKGSSETISYKDDEGKMIYAPGTCPEGPHIGKPVFQFFGQFCDSSRCLCGHLCMFSDTTRSSLSICIGLGVSDETIGTSWCSSASF